MVKIDKLKISSNLSILAALKKMDEVEQKLLLVYSDKKFAGLLSIGDLQRAIINNLPLETPILAILRQNIKYARINDPHQIIREQMITHRIEYMPILNNEHEIVDLIFWEDIIDEDFIQKDNLDYPIVVMAGGEGKRLKPLTNVIPKPLFPFGDTTIIEKLLESYYQEGARDFYISVNYKKNMIREYLSHSNKYKIKYLEEDKPLGTAGSLKLLKDAINRPFFVNNCDIIIHHNYNKIMEFHCNSGNQATLIAAVKEIKIPYGTVETGEEGQLKELNEKPQLTYFINTGLYILNPEVIRLIPHGTHFDITDLFDTIKSTGGSIGVFPISENSWSDIGEWQYYRKALEKF